LAGAQWAINSALLEILGNASSSSSTPRIESFFPVTQIQRTPREVQKGDFEPPLIFVLLPAVMHVLAAAVAT